MGIIHTAKKNLANEFYIKLKKNLLEEIARNGPRITLTKHEEADVRITDSSM